MKSNFMRGINHGIPIALGYLSVSFGFGILAVKSGLSALVSVIISATNLTSAGQAAGVGIIASGGALIEMAAAQFTINLRYALMALSLSQKLDKSFTTPKRMLASFGITDEIFAVASAREEVITASYMAGIILISFAGWTGGTLLGALAGQILPASVTSALGIMLYGMFIAIIVPPARKEKKILFVVILAAALSILIRYTITSISMGFAVIICAVIASAAGAVLFPVNDEEVSEE